MSYVCKAYTLHNKRYVGKVLGVFAMVYVVLHGVCLVFAYTYMNSSNSPVLGGVMPLVSVALWWYMAPVAD